MFLFSMYFLLRYKALCPHSLASPSSHALPSFESLVPHSFCLILRFKVLPPTHPAPSPFSLSLSFSLSQYRSFSLSISVFCFSWLQIRPQADLEVFFPSDLQGGLQGLEHTHTHTHLFGPFLFV